MSFSYERITRWKRLGTLTAEVLREGQPQVGGDDVLQHRALHGERRVARALHDQLVEPVGQPGPPARVGHRLRAGLDDPAQVLDAVAQVDEVLLGAAPGEQPGAVRLGDHARLVDVVDRGALDLQQQPDVARGHRQVRRHHLGPAARAAAHVDERLGLQDPERLAQRRPGHPVLLHQLDLGRQRLTRPQLAAHDLAAQVGRDELGGLGGPEDPADLCTRRREGSVRA